MKQSGVITIDGPAGVGKSTLARNLATALDLPYLDTGAMYRTLGLLLGPEAADLSEAELRQKCAAYTFLLQKEPATQTYILSCNGQDVGDEIRTERAGRLASIVARLPVLRQIMQEAQRQMAAGQPLVAEGRDMGTKVFPDAPHKFFLDARPEVRAERRFLQLQAKGEPADKEKILQDIIVRDEQDRNRSIDPLRPAPDAVVVDTSDCTEDEVLARLLEAVQGPKLSHVDASGTLRMVNVSPKDETQRIARAEAVVCMAEETLRLLRENALPKGDVLTVAKVAGIMAAKRTWEFIPLCHPLQITHADIRFNIQDTPPAVRIESEVHTLGRTGVEMEAIVAVQVAAATIYDMAKAVQKDMRIESVRLLYKSGGKSGIFQAQ